MDAYRDFRDINPGVRSNPVWAALTSGNRDLAEGGTLALRYPSDIAPFAAVKEPTPAAFEELSALITENGRAALVTVNPIMPPETLEIQMTAPILQMEATRRLPHPTATVEIVTLGANDVSEMMQLTELTKPGPFGPRTYTLGRYIGIRIDGQLAAMAGERMRFDDRVEVSAVCVHPDFRRRGYAELLITTLMDDLERNNKVPVLHVFASNAGAISLYERLGFRIAQELHVTSLGRRL
ncbi:MAG: GNAT family N-acetyltransferase [Rhizobiaceae bacterium]|nr:GNAT family N-acetyltransferase [Rhizobiaceae bacterium]